MIRNLNYSGKLTDPGALADALAAAGLAPEAARPKAGLFAQAAETLAREGPAGDAPCHAFFVPGRIEVLGKHTDYAGGASLLAAVQRGFCLVAVPRQDDAIVVTDVVLQQTSRFPLAPDLVPRVGHWSNYPMTVARRVGRNFPGARRGCQIAFGSDLPRAAGLSSSSVMIVAMFVALAEVNQLFARPELTENVTGLPELAGYLACVENGQTFGSLAGDRGVGTVGGSEDHTAMLCCQPKRLDEYAYCPVRFLRWLPMPAGYTFVVGATGVVAEKTGEAMEKYNRASRLAATAARLWREATGRDDPHLAAALASSPDAARRLEAILRRAETGDPALSPNALLARFEHFRVEDGQLRPAAGDALARCDLDEFARVTAESQRLAERLLGNQVPEMIHLAATARPSGAVAALAFGAGFGGSVWAMVHEDRLDDFLAAWRDAYLARFPQHTASSQFFPTAPGPAAIQLG